MLLAPPPASWPPPRCQAAQLPQTAPDGTWALHASGLSELWTLPFCPAEPRLAPPQAQLVLCCPIVCRFLSRGPSADTALSWLMLRGPVPMRASGVGGTAAPGVSPPGL